jgi:hypothetical protein
VTRDEKLRRHLDDTYARAVAYINDDFIQRLQKGGADVHYAMEWSQSAFDAAATMYVYGSIIDALDKPDSKVTYDSLYALVSDRVKMKARCPHRSTSQPSNILDQCELEAWATLLDRMDWWKDEGNE